MSMEFTNTGRNEVPLPYPAVLRMGELAVLHAETVNPDIYCNPDYGIEGIEDHLLNMKGIPGPLVVLLDCDHTLLQGSSIWELIATVMPGHIQRESNTDRDRMMGIESESGLTVDEHIAWSKRELERQVRMHPHIEEIRGAMAAACMREGAEAFLQTARKVEAQCYVISASIENALRCVPGLQSVAGIYANKLILSDKGYVTGWDEERMVYGGNKWEYAQAILERAGIKPGFGRVIIGGDNREDANMVTAAMVKAGRIAEEQIFRFCTPRTPITVKTQHKELQKIFGVSAAGHPPFHVVLAGGSMSVATEILALLA